MNFPATSYRERRHSFGKPIPHPASLRTRTLVKTRASLSTNYSGAAHNCLSYRGYRGMGLLTKDYSTPGCPKAISTEFRETLHANLASSVDSRECLWLVLHYLHSSLKLPLCQKFVDALKHYLSVAESKFPTRSLALR